MIIEIVALKSSVSGCKISFVSHGSYFQQSGLLAFRIIFISWAMSSHTEQKHLVSLRIDYFLWLHMGLVSHFIIPIQSLS